MSYSKNDTIVKRFNYKCKIIYIIHIIIYINIIKICDLIINLKYYLDVFYL